MSQTNKYMKESINHTQSDVNIFQRVLENSLCGILSLSTKRDETGQIVDFIYETVNPEAEKILSKTRHELIDQGMLAIYPAMMDSADFHRYCEVVEKGEPQTWETHYNTPELNKWFKIAADSSEDILVINFIDLTAQKQQEFQLLRKEKLLKEAHRMAQIATWEWVPEQDEMLWSDELYHLLGYRVGEVSANYDNFLSCIHPDDSSRSQSLIQTALHNQREIKMDFRVIRKDGSERHVQAWAEVLNSHQELPKRILFSCQDISQQILTLEQVQKERRLYHTLVSNLPNISVLFFDYHLNIHLAKGDPLYFLKHSLHELEGQNLGEILENQEAFPKKQDLLEVIEGKVFNEEIQYEDSYYQVNLIPLRNGSSETSAGIAIYRNIDAYKNIQEKLQNKVEALVKSNKNLEQFAYVASHDLQEPLRKIRAFGDRLVMKYKDTLEATGQDYIRRMQNAATRMQVLIDDLLRFSRVARNEQDFQEVSLSTIIQEVISDLETVIEEKNAQLILDDLPKIKADSLQIRQLFQNLISNALKFSKEDQDPLIHISYQEITLDSEEANLHFPKKICEISVKDNGIGFDNKYAERIFHIFQRLHGRNQFQGTGVGLAICQKIVENHEGYIRAHGQPDQGATFTVGLPLESSS